MRARTEKKRSAEVIGGGCGVVGLGCLGLGRGRGLGCLGGRGRAVADFAAFAAQGFETTERGQEQEQREQRKKERLSTKQGGKERGRAKTKGKSRVPHYQQ